MASEYTPNRRYPLYTDNDKPNLRDQYNGAIREIDTDMADSLHNSQAVADALGSGFDAQHTVRMAIDGCATDAELSSEVSARQAADTLEATARQNADTALGTRIDNEVTARQNADTTLGNRVSTLERIIPSSSYSSSSTVKQAIDSKASNTALSSETTARQNSDNELGTRISNEATARANADTTLGTRITDEATARANADTSLRQAIINTVAQNVVIIGDSYLDNYYNFSCAPYIANKGFNSCTIFGNGGAGFSHAGIRGEMSGMNFNQMITYAQSHLPSGLSANNITDVAFVGGWNDGGHTANAFTYELYSAAIANARTKFPKAKIHVIYTYAGKRDYDTEHIKTYNKYKNWGARLGVSFAATMNTIYYWTSPDGIHPVAEVQPEFIGGFVAACIKNGPQEDIEYYDQNNNVGVNAYHQLYINRSNVTTGETVETQVITGLAFASLTHELTFQYFYQATSNFTGQWKPFNIRVGSNGVTPQIMNFDDTFSSGKPVYLPSIIIQLWSATI